MYKVVRFLYPYRHQIHLSAALIALCLPNSLNANDWVSVIENNEELVSVDATSISLNENNNLEARTLTVRKEDGFQIQRTTEFDCNLYSWRTLSASVKQGPSGQFRPIRTEQPEWGDNTASVDLLLWVCENQEAAAAKKSQKDDQPPKRGGFLFN